MTGKKKINAAVDTIDEKFNWASNVKRAWMFVLGALVIGFALGAVLI